MGNERKKSKKRHRTPALERRPWQFIGLMVVVAIGVIGGAWLFYVLRVATANAMESGTVSPVTMRAWGQYRMSCVLVTLFFLILGIFIFFNNKVSYWIWAVLLIGTAAYSVIKLNLSSFPMIAISLYFTFCEPTRRWLRIGRFKTLPPHIRRKKKAS